MEDIKIPTAKEIILDKLDVTKSEGEYFICDTLDNTEKLIKEYAKLHVKNYTKAGKTVEEYIVTIS